MSTKDEPGPFDGLERAQIGEPVFTLRAHDVLAPPLVVEWVYRRRQAIFADHDMPEPKRELELIQAKEAEDIAERMVEWKAGEVKAPELTAPKHYSGPEADPIELEAKRRFDAIRRAAERIHNSVAEVSEAAASLEEFGYHEIRSELVMYADLLKALGTEVQPKRVSSAHRVPHVEVGR